MRVRNSSRYLSKINIEQVALDEEYLTSIVALLAPRTEGAGRQNEDLLRHSVHLANALGVAHDRQFCLAHAQGNRSG